MLMLGCYRSGECADPEVFVTAAVAVLTRYPDDVVNRVTDPGTGLPGKLKWFPTIYEIREACETENQRAKRIEESIAREQAQFAERDRMAALDEAAKRTAFIRKAMSDLKARLGVSDDPVTLDARKITDAEARQMVIQRHLRELATKRAESEATPLRLSPSALAAINVNWPVKDDQPAA